MTWETRLVGAGMVVTALLAIGRYVIYGDKYIAHGLIERVARQDDEIKDLRDGLRSEREERAADRVACQAELAELREQIRALKEQS